MNARMLLDGCITVLGLYLHKQVHRVCKPVGYITSHLYTAYSVCPYRTDVHARQCYMWGAPMVILCSEENVGSLFKHKAGPVGRHKDHFLSGYPTVTPTVSAFETMLRPISKSALDNFNMMTSIWRRTPPRQESTEASRRELRRETFQGCRRSSGSP